MKFKDSFPLPLRHLKRILLIHSVLSFQLKGAKRNGLMNLENNQRGERGEKKSFLLAQFSIILKNYIFIRFND